MAKEPLPLKVEFARVREEIPWRCKVIRLGDHVVVKGEDEEAIVTAVHPDSQIEVEFLEASDGGPRRRRYAAEALEDLALTEIPEVS